jgi:hypothetical protein
MKRPILPIITASTLSLGGVLPWSAAVAQTANDVVGTWTIVSAVNEQDGRKSDIFGPNPKGALVFDSDGRYALVVLRSDLPKFASNNRATGTPDENRAVVQGSIAHFGTYAVSDAGKTLVFRVVSSTFPNWNGAEQKRPLTLARDELRYTVPAASAGGSAELVWARAK